MCLRWGMRRPRGAGSRGRRDGEGGEWGEVGRGSELARRARGPSAGRERAPLRSAPLAPPLPGRPSSRPAVATSSPDPAGRKGAREGLRFQERAGRPAAGNACSTYFFPLLAPGAAASKKRSRGRLAWAPELLLKASACFPPPPSCPSPHSPLPPIALALAGSGASAENWGAGHVLAPEPLDASPDLGATGPRLLRCCD